MGAGGEAQSGEQAFRDGAFVVVLATLSVDLILAHKNFFFAVLFVCNTLVH